MDHPGGFTEAADWITAAGLRARGSYKWTHGGPDEIPAFVAEMDFGVAPPVEAALLDAVRRADFGYVSDGAVTALAQACASWQRDRYGWTVAPERIRPLPDVYTGLGCAL